MPAQDVVYPWETAGVNPPTADQWVRIRQLLLYQINGGTVPPSHYAQILREMEARPIVTRRGDIVHYRRRADDAAGCQPALVIYVRPGTACDLRLMAAEDYRTATGVEHDDWRHRGWHRRAECGADR